MGKKIQSLNTKLLVFSSFFFCMLLNMKLVLSLSPDGRSLLSLKSAIDQPSDDNNPFSDWNEDDPTPCKWKGIACMNITGFPEPRVVGIAIAGKDLRGYIPSQLGTLVFLRRLNLHNNNFYGSIPVGLFNATSLHSLFLYGNNLSGPLPPSICNLPRLQNLDLSDNSLSGPLPEYLNKCKQLQRLTLSRNKFSGEIPAGIWPNLENLVQLDLSDNEFKGSIPNDLGELKSLSNTLNLSFNHLSGRIPKSLGNLPVAVSFDLRNNNLTGEIPQTGSFAYQGPTAFLNNPLLCGFPLRKSCEHSSQNSPASQNSASGSDSGNILKKGLSSALIALISAVDVAGVAFIGLIIVYFYWKKKDDSRKSELAGNEKSRTCDICSCVNGFSNEESEEEDDDEEKTSERRKRGGELIAVDKGFSFELDELLRASAYVLGKSGLGIVYKVALGNGIPVAVRRLGEDGEQRYKEFVAEVQAIGKVNHPNIVKLRAYYWSPDEKLLISDYISNGNLAYALKGRTSQPSTSLSWATRLRTAKGIARGLAYLHECSPRKFVHGDIKPSNILLDEEFKPHISDFGLTRLINITGKNPSSSSRFIGGAFPSTRSMEIERTNDNYRAPEARIPGTTPTSKWDVYSFGVILLELLTGKSPELSPTTSTCVEIPDVVRWVRKGFEEEKPLSEMVDPALLQEVHAKKQVLAAFHVALACTEADPEDRPRMKTVSQNIEKI